MKALFFLLDGETNASSYHRVLQYFPLLRAAGIEPRASRPVPEGVYQRLVEQGSTTSKKLGFYSLFLACRLMDVLGASRFDVAVIQRDLFPFGPPWLERMLARRNPHLVYDTDDATYLRPAFTPSTPFQRLRRFDKVSEVVRRARWVSAATEPIAAWARSYNSNVSVVPMALDMAEYDNVRRLPATGNRLVIGWAGTAGGVRYLEALAPVLRELATRHHIIVKVISGGYRRVQLRGVPLELKPWCQQSALAEMAEFDIGLVPLDDTPFEQAKFPAKLLQYMAMGIPSVSARVGQATALINHGENGFLAATHAGWRETLEALIQDVQLRQRLAAAARQTVAASYTIERVGPLLVEGLHQAAA